MKGDFLYNILNILGDLEFRGKRLTHFPLLQKLSIKVNNALIYDIFKNLISVLQDSFSTRFDDIQDDK